MNGFSDDDIQWLLELLEEEQLAEIEVEAGDFAVSVKAVTTYQTLVGCPTLTAPAPATADPEQLPDHVMPLLAPIGGTFYHAPSPDVKPFASVGDLVEVGDTVGLVEAMKLYHDVTSPIRGKITKIFVEDQQQVDAEQLLMLIDHNV